MTARAKTTAALTTLLLRWQDGDLAARDALTALIYHDLKRIAYQRLRQQHNWVIAPTELLHETLIRLLATPIAAVDRAQLFKIATGAVRHTLLDIIRRRDRQKRGAGVTPLTLDAVHVLASNGSGLDDWLDIERVLKELETLDPRKSQITELALLIGMEQREIALQLGISLATVERELRFCKAWLHARLNATGPV